MSICFYLGVFLPIKTFEDRQSGRSSFFFFGHKSCLIKQFMLMSALINKILFALLVPEMEIGTVDDYVARPCFALGFQPTSCSLDI